MIQLYFFPNISIECSVGGCGEGVGVVMARPGSAQSKVSQWNQETDFMFSTLLLHMFVCLSDNHWDVLISYIDVAVVMVVAVVVVVEVVVAVVVVAVDSFECCKSRRCYWSVDSWSCYRSFGSCTWIGG